MRIEGDWNRDGAVCVREAFSPDEIRLATEAIEANLADLSPLSKRASTDHDGAFVEDFCSWTRIPQLERFVRQSSAARVAAEVLGSHTLRFFHDHVLVKEPGTAQRTPWHQDLPYYNVEGFQNLSMWIPVDPVPREVTLEFVAGSHLGPMYLPRTFLDARAAWFPEGSLAEAPDIDATAHQNNVLGWQLEPGDAVCFHMNTLHTAAGNPGPHRRRVLSLRFLGEDMVHAPRPWKTSPPFPGLETQLAAGAAMDHPLFPVVWSSS